MSDTTPVVQAVALDELLAQVDELRSKCAGNAAIALRPDPVRLRYIEAMARRLQAAPPAVQAVLKMKLAEALKSVETGSAGQAATKPMETETREASAVRAAPVEGPTQKVALRKPRVKKSFEAAAATAPLSLLGQLNQHLESASSISGPSASGNAPKTVSPIRPPDLKSAVRFRETWARISAETAVDQAAHRAPENAGPLNAHNLVLRTLGLMRELSPDYLRRFMSHAESLMWLDQAMGQLKQPAGKARAVKIGKTKK